MPTAQNQLHGIKRETADSPKAAVAQSLPTFNKVMKPFLRSPEQGADTMVWLATASEPARASGELWFDREIVSKHIVDRTRESDDDRRALRDALVTLTWSDMPAIAWVEH